MSNVQTIVKQQAEAVEIEVQRANLIGEYEELKSLVAGSQAAFEVYVYVEQQQQQHVNYFAAKDFLNAMLIKTLERIATRELEFKTSFLTMFMDWFNQALAPYKTH